jgi:hypothetical protein
MRIRRGLLFWGLFLIPLGAIPLLVRAGILPDDLFTDVWRWWPLLLIGLGLALLLERGRAGLAGTVVVALLLGTLAGSVLASGIPTVGTVGGCLGPTGETEDFDREGTFAGDSTATLEVDCGTLDLTTEPGSGWRAHADYRGEAPRLESTGTSLTLRKPTSGESHRQDWTIALGADAIRDIGLQLNAGSATAVLAGATLDSLNADTNAGDLTIDGTGAAIDDLNAQVNAGRLRITLTSATSGSLQVNAGAIELCVPPDADLELDVQEQLTFVTNLGDRGLSHDGETWTRPGTGPEIDLEVQGNVASFTLDPERGCTE